MSESEPLLLQGDNLSHVWAEAFLRALNGSGKFISPLIVSVTGFESGDPVEDPEVRKALDQSLVASCKQTVHTVANTIFPASLWRVSKYDRHRLYSIYTKTMPRYAALERHKNGRGLYFERLISFGEGRVNQLEFIISEYKSRPAVRQSMFQASVFDPAKDHVRNAQLAFPCLQHVSFVPKGDSLIMNAFYATQKLFDKAYGNYLGLCRLGSFVAREMGLTLARMNCFTGVEKLDTIQKSSPNITPLIEACRNVVAPQRETNF